MRAVFTSIEWSPGGWGIQNKLKQWLMLMTQFVLVSRPFNFYHFKNTAVHSGTSSGGIRPSYNVLSV